MTDKTQAKPYVSPFDGYARTEAQDTMISDLVLATLGGPAGRQILDYLKNITVNVMTPPALPADQLKFLEGQRTLVLMLAARINHARDRKAAAAQAVQAAQAPEGNS